jgi:iron complex transport system substrate-binding protein
MDVVKKLEGLGAKVVAIDPPSIDRLYASMEVAGKVTGATVKAAEVVAKMKTEVDAVTAEVKASSANPPTVFVEVAQNPLYTAGTDTLLNDLITLAGGTNVVKEPGYVGYSLEKLLKDDPQVYLVTKGSMSDPAGLDKRPGFDKLRAVKAMHVFVLDDNLVSRPGPRIVLGLRQVADAIASSR